MTDRSVLIRVPATVGNFGGAAGCAALALDAALQVRASARRDGHVGIRYFGESGERVPRDSANLTVQAMRAALEHTNSQFLGVDLEIQGSVPVGVGLGSSTAAVWAGLLAANQLYGLGLGEKALFELAGTLEHRDDNLRAAWLGGFVACFEEGSSLVCHTTTVPADLLLRVVIPHFESIQRRKGGGLSLSPRDRSACFDRARTLTGFLAEACSPDAAELGETVTALAEKTVPGLDEALRVHVPGLQTVFVCGSGPAVGILAQGLSAKSAVQAVADCLAWHGVATTVAEFRPANAGARDWNMNAADVRLPPQARPDMPQRPLLPV